MRTPTRTNRAQFGRVRPHSVEAPRATRGELGRGLTRGVSRLALVSPSDTIFLNRDLSLLEFYYRVLEEGLDRDNPLLERLKFLAIFASNLDEFFMIRVAGIKELVGHENTEVSSGSMTAAEQLKAIRERVDSIIALQMDCLRSEILPGLKEQGVEVVSYVSLSTSEREYVDEYFDNQVFPVLTPLAVDPAHPFPYISNLSLNLGLLVDPLPELGVTGSLTGRVEPRFVRIKVPPVVPRLVPVDPDALRFVLLEDLIAKNAGSMFPRMRVGSCFEFRVTRDADLEIQEDEAADLLQTIEQSLRKRRFGTPVRLEITSAMPDQVLEGLVESLGNLTMDDVYKMDGPLAIADFMALYKIDRPDLKDRPLRVTVPSAFKKQQSIFEVIRERDILLHHPYMAFSTVTDFIDMAANDPDVLAIKCCLYRTGEDSPVPESLIRASEQGKQVTAVVELKARFDEEKNIEWAKRLEEAGVHVTYGLLGLKTHSKVTLVVRREEGELRTYVHISTGNYNTTTSKVYTDLGLLTADEEIGADATELFNFLTGFSRQKKYRQLLISPVNTRDRMAALIKREIAHARAGRGARIIAVVNRLADREIIQLLYEASQAGVKIDLIVRGICTLKPGVPGLSENIAVRSIVGRFLEHSRIFYFSNGGDDEVYLGSADWMARNLDHRVEVVTPIHDRYLKTYIRDVVLDAYLRDNVKARLLLPDGSYQRIQASPQEQPFDSQLYLEGRAGFSFVHSEG